MSCVGKLLLESNKKKFSLHEVRVKRLVVSDEMERYRFDQQCDSFILKMHILRCAYMQMADTLSRNCKRTQ